MHKRSSNQSAPYLGLLCLGGTGIGLSFTRFFALSFCFCFRFCSLLLGGSLLINVEGLETNIQQGSDFLFSSENLEREVHSNVPLKASHSLTLSLAAALAAFSSAFLASA